MHSAVHVADRASVKLTFAGVEIDCSQGMGSQDLPTIQQYFWRAFSVGKGASAVITLKDGTTNRLISNRLGAGLSVDSGAALTVTCQGAESNPGHICTNACGSLHAESLGLGLGAGIGGNGNYGNYISADEKDAGNITINGGNISAISNVSAGVGGGGVYGINAAGGDGGITTINGGVIHAEGNTGIGGGKGNPGGNGGQVFITGGVTNAIGRVSAAIGGGHCTDDNGRGGNGGKISFTGGVIYAKGENGIGGGCGEYMGANIEGGDGGDITIGGSAIVFATAMNSSTGAPQTSCIGGGFAASGSGSSAGVKRNGGVIFEWAEGKVYDDFTLPVPLTIPEGHTLLLPDGKTLTVPAGLALTVEGTLNNQGTVKGAGELDGPGTFTREGAGKYELKVNRTIAQPQHRSVTATQVVLAPAAPSKGAGDGTVEYGWSAGGAPPAGGWQGSPVFDGLTPDTGYTFFARIGEGEIYKAAMSEGVSLTTATAFTGEKASSIPQPSAPTGDTPQTGDTTVLWPWLLLMLVAFAGCGTLLLVRRKK